MNNAMTQLVAFAAQNSGIERGNYYDYRVPNISPARRKAGHSNQKPGQLQPIGNA
jgi:hypothetical protein